jgi:hypothetical protein
VPLKGNAPFVKLLFRAMRNIELTDHIRKFDDSDPQSEKQEEPRISSFRGMTMDVREEQENACDSIRHNSESDSIEIDQSLLQPKKEPEPRISTPAK